MTTSWATSVRCALCGLQVAHAQTMCHGCGTPRVATEPPPLPVAVDPPPALPPPPTAWAPPPPPPPPPPVQYAPPPPPGWGQPPVRRAPAGGLQLRTLVPLRGLLQDGGWRQGMTGLFVLFAFVPFALLQLTARDQGVSAIAAGFAVYFAVAWGVALRGLIRPDRVPGGLLAKAGAFTLVIGIAVAIVLEREFQADGTHLLSMILGVGFPEEIAKALGVFLFFFLGRRTLWSTRTFLYAGVVSGLVFGACEAVTYSTAYASSGDFTSTPQYTSLLIWRLLTDSLFHACMAGISGWFLGVASWHRDKAVPIIALGLTLVAVLHGTYDRYASSLLGTLVAGVILALFAAYVRSGDQIALQYAEVAD